MLRAVYDWTMSMAGHRHATTGLAVVAFAESSFFPVPPDVALVPMILADRTKAWQLAAICTFSSVIGGIAGYAIGYLLFDTLGQALLGFYGYGEAFGSFTDRYNDYGAWIVFGAGITPFPYKVITIASGVTHLNLLVFMVASVLARGIRFFLVAGLLWYFGEPIRDFIERWLGWLAALFFVLLVGGFVLISYVM